MQSTQGALTEKATIAARDARKALVYFLDSTGIQAPKAASRSVRELLVVVVAGFVRSLAEVTRVSMGVTVIHLALAPSSVGFTLRP